MINKKSRYIFLNYVSKNKSVQFYIFLTAFLAASVYYYFNNPATTLYPPCPFLYLTGFYCPGCGTSRAFHQLLHGNIAGALGYNPLMVISIPFIIYLFISYFEIKINGRYIAPRIIFSSTFYGIIFTVIFGYWVLRNIPVYPFVLLAP